MIRARATLGSLLAIVAIGALTGCGSDERPATTISVELPPAPGVAAEHPALGADGGQSEAPQTASEVEAAPSAEPPAPETSLALETPAGAYPVVWVRAGHAVDVRTEPGGGELVARAGKRTQFGSPTVFGVVKRSGEWAGVSTAMLPNNQLGWIKLDPKRLAAGWTKLAIVVDISERRAELLDDGEVKRAFSVTVGASGVETPTGRFAVTDTFRGDLDPAYGCCALALSATQPHLPSGWFGGSRIAIHGTYGALGIAASHGCVRAADADASALVRRVPLGAPVFIRA